MAVESVYINSADFIPVCNYSNTRIQSLEKNVHHIQLKCVWQHLTTSFDHPNDHCWTSEFFWCKNWEFKIQRELIISKQFVCDRKCILSWESSNYENNWSCKLLLRIEMSPSVSKGTQFTSTSAELSTQTTPPRSFEWKDSSTDWEWPFHTIDAELVATTSNWTCLQVK